MSKLIRLDKESREQLLRDFDKMLTDDAISDGKVSFTKTFADTKRRATVWFSTLAWEKMNLLIREWSTEVAWHGTARRGEDESKDEYFIDDILVYPQIVSGGTVNTDQIPYQDWLMNQEDEVFNSIRMQGHSHVNMSTSPSAVDNTLYSSILQQLDDSMFYIFMIWNKKMEKTIRLYDMRKNTLFETADVDVKVIGLDDFLTDAKKKATTWTAPTVPTAQTGKTTALSQTKTDAAASKSAGTSASGNKSGKKARRVPPPKASPRTPANASDDYYWNLYQDEYDDPYGPFGYREW